MRIMIKGGVWKNTEDEILKAAVMKYGLNQWARISSLLVRKSAKQCKARWYEWLDPNIRKTEWTRDEDEKLLHLAKLMPTQWRTIAPIVGRTPAQCLERYEKLLDAAAAKDDNYDPADDPRRLRPGEIDPNPEAKPARPDPIDMDEDEKEMLSEARARLANTRGKKAKRKSREKQLEEARRLASLQKKRELQAAGIELRQKGSRRRGINYNEEVAFEKKPAIGFFDTAEENQRSKEVGEEFRPQTLEQLEGRRRADIEKALMRADVDRDKLKDRHNRPDAVAKGLELNDASRVQRRGRMMLPAPQVSEQELQQIAKGGGDVDMDPDLAEGGTDATRRLLGDYQTPQRFATPMRTPRAAAARGEDRLVAEAQNLARLQQGQTPLFGGDSGVHIEKGDFGDSLDPRAGQSVRATPSALAGMTPAGGHTGMRSIAGVPGTPSVAGTPLRTPGVGGGGASQYGKTPIRDELGLNDPDNLTVGSTKQAERARQARMNSELRSGLAGLPKPQNEYEIRVPEAAEEADEDTAEPMEEDAADVAARRKAAQKAREEAELRKRSQVLQRGLPRPRTLDSLPAVRSEAALQGLGLKETAEALLQNEVVLLLQHDAAKYPIKERVSKKDKKRKQPEPAHNSGLLQSWQTFEEAELMDARQLVEDETAYVQNAMGHADISQEEFREAWSTTVKDFIYLPMQHKYGRAASATNTDRLDSVRGEYHTAFGLMQKEAERAAKLEKKVSLVTGGLLNREIRLNQQIAEFTEKVQSVANDVVSFQTLSAREQHAGPARRTAAQALVKMQLDREQKLQLKYKSLLDRQDMLQSIKTTAAQQIVA
ncbi:hypothetical protein ABBQ38_013933 [Trebouxia sp. C0009 RCD-2024]